MIHPLGKDLLAAHAEGECLAIDGLDDVRLRLPTVFLNPRILDAVVCPIFCTSESD